MLRLFGALTILVASTLPGRAEPFPSRPVHLIVAYSPGGTGDVVARVIADKLGPALGQSVIVENRPGASGAIGAQAVVNAAPDGHTLLVGQTAEIAVNQYWIKGLTYETTGFADFDFRPWQGFFAPRGTAADVIARLNKEINAVLAKPEVKQKLLDAGANVVPLSTEAFARFVATESEKYQRIIRLTGVKAE